MRNPISALFGVLGRVFQAAVDRIEDPTTALDRGFDQQVRALDETRRGRLAVESAAARLDLEGRRAATAAAACEEQARRAVAAHRDDLARLALAQRDGLLAQASRIAQERELLEEERAQLRNQEAGLAGEVQAFRAHKEVLKAQYGAARARLRVGEAITGYSRDVTNVGADVRRFEDRLLGMQARSRALDHVTGPGLMVGQYAPVIIEQELAMLGAGTRIDDELERIRGEVIVNGALPAGNGTHHREVSE